MELATDEDDTPVDTNLNSDDNCDLPNISPK